MRTAPVRPDLYASRAERFTKLATLPYVQMHEARSVLHAFHGGPWRTIAWLLALRLREWGYRCEWLLRRTLHGLGRHYRPDGDACLVCEAKATLRELETEAGGDR